MAFSEEADEDFKLPLRPWLEKQINSGKFKGLEWELCGGGSKQFRLPWVKKNLPSWEDYYMIFRAWAEHRGRGEAGKLDDSKLKSNFRCALNKSVDFEEITSKSQLQKQTGNYKVYRILTPKEVRERKKKRSKIHAKQEPAFEHNFDSDEFKTIEKKGLDFLDSMDASPEALTSCSFLSETISNGIDMDAPGTFYFPDDDISCNQMTVHPPETDEFNTILAISPAQTQSVCHNDIAMDEKPANSSVCAKTETVESEPEPSARSIILQQLENCGINKAKLNECQLVITYNGAKVFDSDLPNMDRGYRIFHGDQEEQIRLLQLRNTTDEKLFDFKIQGIPLPPLIQESHTMSAILDKTELGVIVRYDPQTLQLYAKRLCQSQVFAFDPHDHSAKGLPTKLEREEIFPLFSLEKYFTEYLQQYINTRNPTPPEAEITLTVGIKPKSKTALRTMKGLKIELVPHALKIFNQNNKDSSNSLSLCFSNPTSMENLLRQIHQNSNL